MFWLVVPVVAYLVPVVDVPTWCQWWRCLPGASGAGGYLPGAGVPGSLRAGGGIYGRHRGRSGRRRISAAGALASESKLQGEIYRCDYSYYQLFRCSFRVRFYGAVCLLKR